jgi:hypothetical protein
MSGLDKIAEERQRQIEEEGWTPEHDDKHESGAMALAAACFATPVKLYQRNDTAVGLTFTDPWPWEMKWDKRLIFGSNRDNPGNVRPHPQTYNDAERIELLTKAGALIAAEIDRLLRKKRRQALCDTEGCTEVATHDDRGFKLAGQPFFSKHCKAHTRELK